MNRFRLSRREWMLFAFPFALLLLSHEEKLRNLDTGFDARRLSLQINPLARARENARSQSCQSNLKQLGLGFEQYLQDYDGRYPINTTPMGGWVYASVLYTKSCPILQCPSEVTPNKPMTPDYWMNGNLNEKSGRGVARDQIDLPAHTYLLGDGDGDGDGAVSSGNYTLTEKTWKLNTPKTDPYAERHLLGANYLFADGHVKWLAPDVVEAGKKDASCCTNYAFKIEIIKAGNAAEHQKHHAAHHSGQHNH